MELGTRRELLLVGSVPLGSAAQVFETCAQALGDRILRLPDGETGERSNWITWQRAVLGATPGLTLIAPAADEAPPAPPRFRLRGDHVGPVRFSRLGFSDAAIRSWADFKRLRDAGRIGASQRFQVSLPTPLAVVAQYIEASSQAAAEAPYAEALIGELREILAHIPHRDLAIQWDVAVEFAVLEGLRPVHFAPVYEGVIARLTELCRLVPAPVELGIHLCYGDSGHKHFKEPDDTAYMVRVANALAAESPRPLAWLHMPVPRTRDDVAFFKPLEALRLSPGCRLFLGLVHVTDGIAGARKRIAAALPFAPKDFGIATECGFGRRDPRTVPDLLRLHVEI